MPLIDVRQRIATGLEYMIMNPPTSTFCFAFGYMSVVVSIKSLNLKCITIAQRHLLAAKRKLSISPISVLDSTK